MSKFSKLYSGRLSGRPGCTAIKDVPFNISSICCIQLKDANGSDTVFNPEKLIDLRTIGGDFEQFEDIDALLARIRALTGSEGWTATEGKICNESIQNENDKCVTINAELLDPSTLPACGTKVYVCGLDGASFVEAINEAGGLDVNLTEVEGDITVNVAGDAIVNEQQLIDGFTDAINNGPGSSCDKPNNTSICNSDAIATAIGNATATALQDQTLSAEIINTSDNPVEINADAIANAIGDVIDGLTIAISGTVTIDPNSSVQVEITNESGNPIPVDFDFDALAEAIVDAINVDGIEVEIINEEAISVSVDGTVNAQLVNDNGNPIGNSCEAPLHVEVCESELTPPSDIDQNAVPIHLCGYREVQYTFIHPITEEPTEGIQKICVKFINWVLPGAPNTVLATTEADGVTPYTITPLTGQIFPADECPCDEEDPTAVEPKFTIHPIVMCDTSEAQAGKLTSSEPEYTIVSEQFVRARFNFLMENACLVSVFAEQWISTNAEIDYNSEPGNTSTQDLTGNTSSIIQITGGVSPSNETEVTRYIGTRYTFTDKCGNTYQATLEVRYVFAPNWSADLNNVTTFFNWTDESGKGIAALDFDVCCAPGSCTTFIRSTKIYEEADKLPEALIDYTINKDGQHVVYTPTGTVSISGNCDQCGEAACGCTSESDANPNQELIDTIKTLVDSITTLVGSEDDECPCGKNEEEPKLCAFGEVTEKPQTAENVVYKFFGHKGGDTSQETIDNVQLVVSDGCENRFTDVGIDNGKGVEDLENWLNSNLETWINANLGSYGFAAIPFNQPDPDPNFSGSTHPNFMRLTYPINRGPWQFELKNLPSPGGQYDGIRYTFDGTNLSVDLIDAAGNVVVVPPNTDGNIGTSNLIY